MVREVLSLWDFFQTCSRASIMCEMVSSWTAQPVSYVFLYLPHLAPLEHCRFSITVKQINDNFVNAENEEAVGKLIQTWRTQ